MKKIRLIFTSVLLVFAAGLAYAQDITVSGVIKDASTGETVPLASILIKGTSSGVASDEVGAYTITVPSNATLVFGSIGYQNLEVPVNGRTKIDVSLHPDSEILDGAIVVAYGTSTKGSFTGSASVMKADKLEKRQVSNISNALSGAVAGVQIQSANGQPGTSATVRIRGVGSINASGSPLYVVDGIPFDGDLSSLNMTDIESMTVLKDAASTALYGARGANGIIMITTKKAKSGKAVVTFDAKVGSNSRAIKNYDVLTSTEEYLGKAYQAIYNAALYNLKKTPAESNAYANENIFTTSAGGTGYPIYTIPAGQSLFGLDGVLNPNATLGYVDGDYYYIPDNWANETFSNQMRQQYDLTVSGSTDKSNIYFSLGFLEDGGVISGSGFERYNGRLKGDYQVAKWLKVGANANFAFSESRYPGEQTNSSSSGNAFFLANNIAPVYPVYVRSSSDKQIRYIGDRKVYDYGDGNSTPQSRRFMSIANPIGDLIYNKTEYLSDIFGATWFAEITPIEGLTLTAKYGLNIDNTRYNDLGNAYMGQSASYGGTAYQSHQRTNGFDQQYIANYLFTIGDDHSFDLTAGYDGYEYNSTLLTASGQNLYNPESFYVSNAIDNLKGSGSKSTYATEGYFGRINYSYKDTYIANVSYRRDASSRFAPENRWGNFWSASAAWVISREDFMQDAAWVNLLKLKASFGQQGNDGIGNNYAWLDQYSVSGANGVFSDGTLSYKGNRDLTWETSTSYNVGVEFSLFNNSLNGSVEYFGRKSGDMLYYKPVAGSLGYTQIPMNVGSMTNSGVEIDLSYNIFTTDNFNWNINGNATLIKNKINSLHKDLNGQLIDGSRIYEEGYSMYRMYLVEWAGVDAATGEALYWTKDESEQRVTTNDYSQALEHKIATDDLLPKVYGGFGTTLNFYGFDASIQCAYQLGGQIFDSGYQRFMHGGVPSSGGQNWHVDIKNAWTPENTNTNVPRLDANDKYANSTSTRFLESSNYLSINNITFGYSLPKKVVNKLMLERIRIYLAADNVALLSARKGLDPRQSYISATTAIYTPLRTVSGGINITF